jgi:hypothetical protein
MENGDASSASRRWRHRAGATVRELRVEASLTFPVEWRDRSRIRILVVA